MTQSTALLGAPPGALELDVHARSARSLGRDFLGQCDEAHSAYCRVMVPGMESTIWARRGGAAFSRQNSENVFAQELILVSGQDEPNY